MPPRAALAAARAAAAVLRRRYDADGRTILLAGSDGAANARFRQARDGGHGADSARAGAYRVGGYRSHRHRA